MLTSVSVLFAAYKGDLSYYIEGAKVKHPKFGIGVIIKKENIGDITFVKIDFGGFGVKNLSLAFAPLELIK